MIDLSEYMRVNIRILLRDAIRASLKNPGEFFFLLKMALASRRAYSIRESYEKKGKHVPPFLIASITTSCNLHCKGCYAIENHICRSSQSGQLTARRWAEIFREASEIGVGFILLAGGEPLMRREVLEEASRVRNILFPVFTNGTMLDDGYRDFFRKNRNMIPVLSLEGDLERTDERRGEGVYNTLTSAMNDLQRSRVFFCTSITVTNENLPHVTGKEFLDGLTAHGCKLVFYVEYTPVDGETRALALSDEDRKMLDARLDDLRRAYRDVIFISFPGDEKLTGGCLAAGRGFFHINPDGDAEPCPFSPYSDLNLKDHSLLEAMDSALFRELNRDGYLLQEHEGGCLLFEKRTEVEALLNK